MARQNRRAEAWTAREQSIFYFKKWECQTFREPRVNNTYGFAELMSFTLL